jgi:hypothetical protein
MCNVMLSIVSALTLAAGGAATANEPMAAAGARLVFEHRPVVNGRHIQPHAAQIVTFTERGSNSIDEAIVDTSPRIGRDVDEIYRELMK